MPTERQTGIVAKWLNHKGIGFITPDGTEGEGNDVLVHFEQIKQETEDGFKSLQQGAKVEFELQADPKNPDSGRQVAVNVTGEEGADCEPKKKGQGKGGKGKRGKGKGRKGKGKKSADDAEEKEGDEE